MLLLTSVSFFATASILFTYARSARWFDWANAIGWVPLTLQASILGAYPSAFISASFGLIAIHRLVTSS